VRLPQEKNIWFDRNLIYRHFSSFFQDNKASTSKTKADSINAAHYSTGMVAAGLTSTVMEPLTMHESDIVDERTLRYDRVKKKGYVRLVTNYGPLNLELFCDQTPKACENFIQHCRTGYYKGTSFHRLIKNFMVSQTFCICFSSAKLNLLFFLGSRWRSNWNGNRRRIDFWKTVRGRIQIAIFAQYAWDIEYGE
jgi:hypothetical protein